MKPILDIDYRPENQLVGDNWEDTYQARLTVGHQSFGIGHLYETRAEAEWLLGQFQIALDNLTCQKCGRHEPCRHCQPD